MIALIDISSVDANGNLVKKYPANTKIGILTENMNNGMLKINGNEFVQEKNVAVVMKEVPQEKKISIPFFQSADQTPESGKGNVKDSIQKNLAYTLVIAAVVLFMIGKKGWGIGVGIAGLIMLKPIIFKK